MTDKTFNDAKEILGRLNSIRTLYDIIHDNTSINDNTARGAYIYFKDVDNKQDDLKNIIRDWCRKEQNKLLEEFKNL